MTPLYTPSAEDLSRAHLTRYLAWLRDRRGLDFATYGELWRWSVDDLDGFWSSLWAFFDIHAARSFDEVLEGRTMPGARWFAGARLNYVDQVFRWPGERPAIEARSEEGATERLTYAELEQRTAAAAARLRELGVTAGDRVAAYAPNVADTVVAFLATASLGAIWSACSPDFGATAVLDRFRQIEPKVLLTVEGYRFKGAWHDRREVVADLRASLSGTAVVALTDLAIRGSSPAGPPELRPVPVPFEHPLWVLYSSGTTGLPKALVHGHGGILLEHLKSLVLQMDLGPGDRFFWFTTTGWMMWNLLVGGLLAGACIVLYDGSPAYPDLGALWRLAADAKLTYFGVSAPYIQSCMKAGVVPRRLGDLSALRGLGSTGAPLDADGFRWVYANVGDRLLLGSVSGGTDVCSAFVGSSPLLPVEAGEIQCRFLGADVASFDPAGRSLVDEVGELVVTSPMPSMPLRLWNDPDGSRYRSSYFETYPGVWRHGDWVRITPTGSCVIYGRSDATLNRGGVRVGTSELYRVVEGMPEIVDSLAVDTGRLDHEGRLHLFVVLAGGLTLDATLRARITQRLRTDLSPRHVPDEIRAVPEIPRTLNGKKLELPVKRLLLGEPLDDVVSVGAVANPDALAALLPEPPP